MPLLAMQIPPLHTPLSVVLCMQVVPLGSQFCEADEKLYLRGVVDRQAGSTFMTILVVVKNCKHSRVDVAKTVGATVAPRYALLVVEDGTVLRIDLPATESCSSTDARLLAHALLAPSLHIGAAAGGWWLELACRSVAALAGATGTRVIASSPRDLAAVDAASRSLVAFLARL